jgi:hypothetical protein
MHINRLACLALLSLFLLPGAGGMGQNSAGFNPVLANTGQFGFMFGPVVYRGDLNMENFTLKRSTGLGAGLYGQYYFSNVFGFRVTVSSGIYNGGIKYYQKNKVDVEDSFTGLILEGDLRMIINFSDLFFGVGEKRKFIVYGFGGLGFGGWYSKLTNKIYIFDSLSVDNPLSNFNAAFVVPAGLGFYYRLGNRVNVGLEYTFRNYFSDKLDNSVAGYPYDQAHQLALNLSFNLGTGMASRKPATRSRSMETLGYSAAYPSAPYPVYRQPAPVPVPSPVVAPPPIIPKEPVKERPVPETDIPLKKPVPKTSPGCSYAVQIFAFASHKYTAAQIRKKYRIEGEVWIEKAGGTERFMTGRCGSPECAARVKKSMQAKGIRDAFIVIYRGGKR